ncbi:MAG: MarR family transcriptional regulator [Coraliomargarita sp.]|nr:MarR family transcriptional regulator [Coraliomargarita sp.]
MPNPRPSSHEQMHELANSVRRLYNCLRHTSDELHAESEVSAPKRTLLMDLQRYGPQTVPALARSRFISRQIIQTQINELVRAGFVESKPNPEHKRSKLIALTDAGIDFLKQLSSRERDYMDSMDWSPDSKEVAGCIATLDEIYEQLRD